MTLSLKTRKPLNAKEGLNPAAHERHVSTALHRSLKDSHDLTHATHPFSPRLSNSRLDHRCNLFITQRLWQVILDNQHLRLFYRRKIITASRIELHNGFAE